MKLTANGYISTTLVDGTTFTGLYAPDGSINIFDTSALSGYKGLYHPSGALNVFGVDGTSPVGVYAPNGAINVITGSVVGQMYHPSGAWQVSDFAVFHPATSLTNALVYDPSDVTSLRAARDGSGAQSTVGGFVGWQADVGQLGGLTVEDYLAANPAAAVAFPANLPGAHLVALADDQRGTLQETVDGDTFVQLDNVNDLYNTTLPARTGTVVYGMSTGIVRADVNIPAGAWNIFAAGNLIPGNKIHGIVLADGINDAKATQTATWLQDRGAGAGNHAGVTSMTRWFRGRTDLTRIYSGNWNTSAVTNFSLFVAGCPLLTTLDVSAWNTSAVTTFQQFAQNCTSLTNLNVSNWDTSAVTNFQEFTFDCTSLTNLNVSNWDTSAVTNFISFARACRSLTNLNVSNWDTSAVTNFALFVFDCTSLTTLDVSAWNTSAVTNFALFVQNCTSLTTLDVSTWNTIAVTTFQQFAQNCTSLTTLDVSNWNTAAVTNFASFAQNCISLTTLNVSNWNTGAVTNFQQFASDCISLTNITITGGTGTPFRDSPCINYSNAFTNCALNQTTIDTLLVEINAAGTSGGTLNMNGGTNSPPSVTGLAAKAALEARGWTVTVNV